MEIVVKKEDQCPFRVYVGPGFVYGHYCCNLTNKDCYGFSERFGCPLLENKTIEIKLVE